MLSPAIGQGFPLRLRGILYLTNNTKNLKEIKEWHQYGIDCESGLAVNVP